MDFKDMRKLEQMLEMQRQMVSIFTKIPNMPIVDSKERQRWTNRYLNCVVEEVVEAQRELPIRKFWKPGAEDQEVNEEALLEEYVDILHFLMAVAMINGWTAETVFEKYSSKYEKNKQRFNVK